MHYSNNPIKWKTNNIGIASLRKSLGSILIGVLDSTEKPLFFISGIIACCMTIGTTLLVLIVVLWRSLWPHSMYGWQYTLLKRFTLVDIIIVSMLLVSLESAFGLIQTRDTNALVHITPDTVRYLRSGIPLIMIGFIYMHLIKILVNIFLLNKYTIVENDNGENFKNNILLTASKEA
jgi:hypothetical protein